MERKPERCFILGERGGYLDADIQEAQIETETDSEEVTGGGHKTMKEIFVIRTVPE